MDHAVRDASADFIESLCAEYQKHNQIDPAFMSATASSGACERADGTGVMAGVTQIGNVMGYYVQDGERIPAPGKLVYRGIDVEELINGLSVRAASALRRPPTASSAPCPPGPSSPPSRDCSPPTGPLPPMFTEDMIPQGPQPRCDEKLALLGAGPLFL